MAERKKANNSEGSRKALASDKAEERIRARNMLKILEAATEVFSRKGLDGTRINEVAELSGLPKGNVYYYFSSKEEIYKATISHLINSWDEAFQHISADREPAEAIEGYVKAKLEHARRNVAETRLFANEVLQGAQHLSDETREHMRQVTSQKVAVVSGWIAAGKLAPVDPRHLFIMLWSTTQFYADFEALACDALQVGQLKAADYADAAKTITQTILNGLLPRI